MIYTYKRINPAASINPATPGTTIPNRRPPLYYKLKKLGGAGNPQEECLPESTRTSFRSQRSRKIEDYPQIA